MTSEALVDWLKTLEERPWPEFGKQLKPITTRQVAGILAPFGIRSKKIRINSAATAQGYAQADCVEMFSRYLPSRSGTAEQTSNDAAKDAFRSGTAGGNVPDEKTGFAASDQACSGVPDREAEQEKKNRDVPDHDSPYNATWEAI